VYHGTDSTFDFNNPQPGKKEVTNLGKVMMSKKDVISTRGNEIGFSVTRDAKRALDYGKNTHEFVLSPNAKIATAKDLPEVFKQFDDGKYFNQSDAVRLAKEKGFDGVDLHDLELQTPKPTKNQEIQVFNKDALISRQQLTDLYNQAHAEATPQGLGKVTDPMQRVFDKNPMAPSKGFILKEGQVVGGKQDVLVAKRNPQSGRLEVSQESRPAPNVQKMSDAEFASLARRVDQEAPVRANDQPPQKRLQDTPAPAKSTSEPYVGSPNTSRTLEYQGQKQSEQAGTRSNQVPPQKANTETSSYVDNIPPESKGSPSYPVKKKIAAIDYVRTPEKVLNKVGLEKEAQQLLKADHKYKLTLPKEIDKVSKWYDEVNRSPEASQRIFQKLDGQKVALNPKEQKVATEIKQYLKEWADRLGLPEEELS
jgi:hypothetical protein